MNLLAFLSLVIIIPIASLFYLALYDDADNKHDDTDNGHNSCNNKLPMSKPEMPEKKRNFITS